MRLTLTATVVGLVFLVAGCSEDPQQRYERAAANLEAAKQARAEAQTAVDKKKAELRKLQEKLAAAEARLQKARERMSAASDAVDKSVSDEVLFRSIQRAVLDDDRFAGAAIAVGVKDRVVTLTGKVPDEATREAAMRVAREHAGVKDVVDFLEVDGGDGGGRDDDRAPTQQSEDSAKGEEK